jgi:hypothetical protein
MDPDKMTSNSMVAMCSIAAASVVVAIVGYSWLSTSTTNGKTKKTKKSKSSKSGSSSSSKPVPRTTQKKVVDNDDDNANLRGYKKLADGRVTSYFSRELSEQEKALLGDSTPKRIDSNGAVASTGPVKLSETPISGSSKGTQSVWNAAGTWEERDCSEWAKKKLKEMLTKVKFMLPSSQGSVTVTTVRGLQGDASITLTRGKKKYIYDYSAEIDFQADLKGDKVKGTVNVSEITGESSYEIAVRLSGSPAASARTLVSQYIQSSTKGLQAEIVKTLDSFLDEFKSTHG